MRSGNYRIEFEREDFANKLSWNKLCALVMIVFASTSIIAAIPHAAASPSNQSFSSNSPSSINAATLNLLANFTFTPTNPNVDVPVYFDASSSYSSTFISFYQWSWGDGSLNPDIPVESSNYRTVSHTFQLNGTFTVTLTVFDSNGASATTSHTITVNMINSNTPPAALFTYAPTKPIINQMVTFDASASRDPDGDAVASYQWSGGAPGGGGIVPGTQFNATGVTFTHTFPTAGVYVIALTVADNHQLSSNQYVLIAVTRIPYMPGVRPGDYGKYYFSTNQTSNSGLLAVVVNVTQVVGTKVTSGFDVMYPNGTAFIAFNQTTDVYSGIGFGGSFFITAIAANLTAGDGLYSYLGSILQFNYTTTKVIAGASREVTGLSYGASGSGRISLEYDRLTGLLVYLALESSGQGTEIFLGDTNAWTPTGNEDPLPLFYWTPSNPNPGQSVSFDASLSYDPDHDAISYLWDFGDGGPTSMVARPTHTYASNETYVVTLTASDGLAGGSASATKAIQVGAVRVHDVAVRAVSASTYSATIGQTVDIFVQVADVGTFPENVTVQVTAGGIFVSSQAAHLSAGGSQSLTFAWDTHGRSPGPYTISVYAVPVPGETSTGNNYFTDGLVTLTPTAQAQVSIFDDNVCSSNDFSCTFGPPSITVAVGTSVTWSNGGLLTHTVTSCAQSNSPPLDACPASNDPSLPSFDSGALSAGQMFQYDFTSAGTYYYYDSVHTWMHGEVIVRGPSPRAVTMTSLNCLPSNILANQVSACTTFVRDLTIRGLGYSVVATFPASGSNSVAVNSNTNTVYILNYSPDNSVSVISGSTYTVEATIPVGINPFAVAVNPNTNMVYVTSIYSNTTSVISGSNNTVVATIPVGPGQPQSIAVNPNTNMIYVTNDGSDTVTVISGSNNTVVAKIPLSSFANGIAVDPKTNMVYVANSPFISVISGSSNAVIATIPVEADSGVAVNPDTNTVYATSWFSNTTSVVSGSNNSVVAIIKTGAGSSGVAVDPTTNLVYVANQESGTISIISGSNNTIVATINAELTPIHPIIGGASIAIDPNTETIYMTNYPVGYASVISRSSNPTTPTGTVSFSLENTSTATGSFAPTSCSVSPFNSTTATCSVSFAGSTGGTAIIQASYGGDPSHSTSQNSTSVTVVQPSTPDFSISASSPSPVNVGQLATSTITVTGLNGFTGTVALSVPPTTGNLTCNAISPGSVNGSDTATLSCNSSTANTYTVTITGRSGNVTHTTTATFTFTMPQVFDFSLSTPSPSSLTVVQGGLSPSASIDATLVNGTTAHVTFSASGLPTGVTATFTNNSCSPTCTVTIHFSATSTATLGTSTITINVSGGGASHSTSLSLTVSAPAAFDFSLGVPSPNALTAVQGSASPTSSITATLVSGTTTPVTYSASGLPNGVTATFTNNPCSPTCSLTVTFSATSSATLGTVTVTISASGGGAGHSTSLSLTVTAPVTTQFTFATIDFPGASFTSAGGINNLGEIVGSYVTSASPCVTYASGNHVCRSGYLISLGSFSTINGPPGNTTAILYLHAINGSSYIVGAYLLDGQFYGIAPGFVFFQGTYTIISSPSACTGATDVNGINDMGQIVGEYEQCSGATHGYALLSGVGGSFTTIDYPGATVTVPQSINNAGQIAGIWVDSSNHQHGFSYAAGTYTSIDYPNATSTSANAINNAGQIVGTWQDSSGKVHGFLRSADGSFASIDYPDATTTTANGINDNGQIVGDYVDAAGNSHGYSTILPTSTSLTCSPSPVTAGSSSTCTVQVTGSNPTGTVSFTQSGSTTVTFSSSTCTLSSGNCSVQVTSSSAGSVSITATYPGDLGNAGSTGSTSLNSRSSSSVSVSCAPSSVNVGRFTTCSASVTGSSPSGQVTFTTSSSTGTLTPSSATCTLSSGSCSVTYADTSSSSLTAMITASYNGDANNAPSSGTFALSVSKPAGIIAVGTTSSTLSNGGVTANQSTVTGISVTITGSTGSNGTPVGVTTQDLSAAPTGVGIPNLTSPSYYDVQVTGITTGNAQVCISFTSASSSTIMQYWDGTAWTSASGITVNGSTVCGTIPVSALTGTNIALGNTVNPVAPTPTNYTPVYIGAGLAAIIVLGAVFLVLRRRRGSTSARA